MPPVSQPVRQVLLVGNYRRDRQESMLRFTAMLHTGLLERGFSADVIEPGVVLGRGRSTWSGPGKWLAYLDKYILFPLQLRRRMRGVAADAVVHICDHSNAVYTPAAASAGHRVLVTCHDLGAVRGALGEETDCPATSTGKILQRWIAHSLGLADTIACVSAATCRDVERLIRRPDGTPPNACVVPLGQNAPYHPLPAAEADARLRQIPDFDPALPFVLNVGSSLRRKNREGVLRIFAQTLTAWPRARLVFAGEALTPELVEFMHPLGLDDTCVRQVVSPSNELLEALYSRALALLFPSRFEGFGWPAIEAQACGCPVLCSAAGALGEVVAQSGFVRTPEAEADFAGELVRLAHDPGAGAEWARLGFENAARFTTEKMLNRYVELYADLSPLASAHEPATAAAGPA